MNKFKTFGSIALGASIIVGLFAGLVLMIFLGTKAAAFIAPYLLAITGFIFIVNIIALLAALIPAARAISGFTLLISSYIYGLTTWLYGLVVTMALWGIVAVLIGLFLGFIGIVPIGILASLFNGEWGIILNFIMLSALTYGSRIAGTALLTNFDNLSSAGSGHRDLSKRHRENVIDIDDEDIDVRS